MRRMAIKTDMSKAYDIVEWCFIEEVMRNMGFAEIWIQWIMKCITSVSYHVLLNGQPHGNIQPHRRLRQGDPLSPFIFILCIEALVGLLKGAKEEGKISGIKAAKACSSISHLLFAYDSLFFCKAEARECLEVMRVLQIYGTASGQCINLDKSSILFGKKVPDFTKEEIKKTQYLFKLKVGWETIFLFLIHTTTT